MSFYYVLPPDDSVLATISDKCDIDFVEELQEKTCKVLFKLEKGALVDIVANDLGWPLYSKKVKDLIDSAIEDKSHYVWHKVSIATPQSVSDYYVPQFLEELDVLNVSNSIYAEGGFVVKACIEPTKAHNIGMFTVPGSDSRIIISKDICCMLGDNGVDTAHFETVSTAPNSHQ